jgi:hypothetical protein
VQGLSVPEVIYISAAPNHPACAVWGVPAAAAWSRCARSAYWRACADAGCLFFPAGSPPFPMHVCVTVETAPTAVCRAGLLLMSFWLSAVNASSALMRFLQFLRSFLLHSFVYTDTLAHPCIPSTMHLADSASAGGCLVAPLRVRNCHTAHLSHIYMSPPLLLFTDRCTVLKLDCAVALYVLVALPHTSSFWTWCLLSLPWGSWGGGVYRSYHS